MEIINGAKGAGSAGLWVMMLVAVSAALTGCSGSREPQREKH